MTVDLTRGRAIVTYGRSLIALTVAQSLGRRGVEVIGGDDVGMTVLTFSRYAKSTFVHAPAASEPEQFIDDLEAAILRHKPHDDRPYVLIPCFQETRLIARHAERLGRHIKVAAPSFGAISAVDPKDNLMRTARDLGIRAPAACMGTEWGMERLGSPSGFPVVVKPVRGVGGRGVRKIDAADDLETTLAEAACGGANLKIQEYIEGDDYCLTALFDHGVLKASAAYHNIYQYPRGAGAGVVRETVCDRPFLKSVKTLFEPLGWTGVVEVDFRWDGVNEPYLIEVNPRFWAGLFHSVESGMDFPWMLYVLAATGVCPEPTPALLGRRTKVAGLHILAAIQHVADSDEAFSAAKAAWAEATSKFQNGQHLGATWDLIRAVGGGSADVARAASRLRVALQSMKGAPNEGFAPDDPLVSLGWLFVVASLIRHGRLPPELKNDPMATDLVVS